MEVMLLAMIGSFLLLMKIRRGVIHWILCGVLVFSTFLVSGALFPNFIVSILLAGALLFIALMISSDPVAQEPEEESTDVKLPSQPAGMLISQENDPESCETEETEKTDLP